MKNLTKREADLVQKLAGDYLSVEALDEWLSQKPIDFYKTDRNIIAALARREGYEIITAYKRKSYAAGFIEAIRCIARSGYLSEELCENKNISIKSSTSPLIDSASPEEEATKSYKSFNREEAIEVIKILEDMLG